MNEVCEIKQKDQEDITLTSREHLESLLYQFVKLYERWSEDRQVAAKQSSDIAQFIEEFSDEVDRLSKIEDAVIAKLKKGLEQTTVSISSMVYEAVSRSLDKKMDDSAHKMKESVRQAERLLSEYQSTLNWSHWKIIAITAITSIAASLLAVWWFMPKPTLPLTDGQIKAYQSGQVLDAFWPKLSTRQQNWLTNLALGKTNNHEKLVEDTKKQYSGLSDSQANEIVSDAPTQF